MSKVYRLDFKTSDNKTISAGNIEIPSGEQGTRGSRWNTGTAITGTSTTATIFSGSGITDALANDMYLNTSTWNIYQCTTGGNASTAKWKYLCNIKGVAGGTGAAGVGIKAIGLLYCQTTSNEQPARSLFKAAPPSIVQGHYMHHLLEITSTKNDIVDLWWCVYNPIDGTNGSNGTNGVSITSISIVSA